MLSISSDKSSTLLFMLHKSGVFLVGIICSLGIYKMLNTLLQTNREYRHIQKMEQEQTQKVEHFKEFYQQQEEYLHHLLSDEEFLEHIIKQRMGYLHKDEVLFHFEPVLNTQQPSK